MEDRIAHLIERFPDREKIIRSLTESSARFQDLIKDHHEVHRRLSRSETEGDPQTQQDLESRLKNLEQEMIDMMQGGPMM